MLVVNFGMKPRHIDPGGIEELDLQLTLDEFLRKKLKTSYDHSNSRSLQHSVILTEFQKSQILLRDTLLMKIWLSEAVL